MYRKVIVTYHTAIKKIIFKTICTAKRHNESVYHQFLFAKHDVVDKNTHQKARLRDYLDIYNIISGPFLTYEVRAVRD